MLRFFDICRTEDVYADGIHDDTAAIQKCLDEMKDGGTVYFPDGTYLISSALIFYSNQHLLFSDKAVLLRSDKSEVITKYMLASFSEPDVGGYEGTHDVVISGGIFDGNENLTEKLTIVNTVHCSNITIKNVSFIHGAMWHCIELNSTKNATVTDCVFDGKSYTVFRENLTSELIQVDAAYAGTYGPVYNCDGTLIDFNPDGTPCSDIRIESCVFKCGGFPAIGHHGNDAHNGIDIRNNVFEGSSGIENNSRGFISFIEKTYDVNIHGNAFISHANKKTKAFAVVTQNPCADSCTVENNVFCGHFSDYFIGGISAKDNVINF